VEANTLHTHAVAGQAHEGASLPWSPRNGYVEDEATARIDRYLSDSKALALHRRRLPGIRRDVSHLVVGPAGVTVVDSHGYVTSPIKFDWGDLRGSARRRSKRLKAVLSQVEAVRELLADTPYAKVPIEAAIVQRKVTGARVLQGLNTPRIIVCGPRTIAHEASRKGPLSATRVRALAAYLNSALD